jgi:capsid portal protein
MTQTKNKSKQRPKVEPPKEAAWLKDHPEFRNLVPIWANEGELIRFYPLDEHGRTAVIYSANDTGYCYAQITSGGTMRSKVQTLDECDAEYVRECIRTAEHWEPYVEAAKTGYHVGFRVARIKGRHYVLGDETAKFKGSYGRKHTIKFDSGEIVETTNLWDQGQVPPAYAVELADNATFIWP